MSMKTRERLAALPSSESRVHRLLAVRRQRNSSAGPSRVFFRRAVLRHENFAFHRLDRPLLALQLFAKMLREVRRRFIAPRDAGDVSDVYTNPKDATRAFFRVDVDVAPHEIGELSRDRQAEARSAVNPGGGSVGLREGFENLLECTPGHAYAGVHDADVKDRTVAQSLFAVPVDQRRHGLVKGQREKETPSLVNLIALPTRFKRI
jgi:hypothetical protein